ncbi:MFS transporter [Mycobacterium talmoniae]|uniref:MFS transporter n=1 Tax=Mycobacterium talmoniae TaxID=1858794 RepID=A0A1S1MTY3_9MYCO|nr:MULTISPECIES: MFS transporter [Mycobacterium]OHU90190.1 MFS transporter [Mycobacterium talmoniae]TDH53915.1 MFS transporter [Mycobacterium eburneum]
MVGLDPALAPPGQRSAPTESPRARTWTLIVACLGVTLVISSMIALNVALGDIAIATSATQTQLTWVVDGYTLALACLLLPAGALADRYGRRGALLTGLCIFTLASLAPTMFDTPVQIILARAAAGVGAAFIMPATLSLLTAAYPKHERAKAIGIWAGLAGSGAVLGMLGSGLLLLFWPWQSIFWAFTGAGNLLIALTCTISSSRDDHAAGVDWPGAVLIGGAVAIFVFGIVEAPARGWTHPLVYGCIVAGLMLAAAFAVVELRRRHPLLDIRLFANPSFATGAATVTMMFFANFGFFYVSMQHIQLVMGYSALKTAVALSPLMAPVLTLSALSPWYVPRLGLRLTLFVGLLLISTGFICLRALEIDSPYWHLAWPLLVMSTGIGLCTAPPTSAIMTATPDDKQGVASAVNDTTREVGAALGIAVAGSILATQYGRALSSQLSAFPETLRDSAHHSLAEALRISTQLGPYGAPLAEQAKSAFLTAVQYSTWTMAIIIAVAALVIGAWAPGRDGQQLRPVRWLTSRRRH